MACSLDWEPNGVYMKICGVTSGSEIDNTADQIRNHPDLGQIKYVVADYLAVDEFNVTAYETLLIAAHDHWCSKTNPTLKIALVGNKAEVLEAFQRYVNSAVIKNTFEVRIFSVLEEARRWVSSCQIESSWSPTAPRMTAERRFQS